MVFFNPLILVVTKGYTYLNKIGSLGVADVFFRNFPKIFRTAILKENLPKNVPYFIKKHRWMSASNEATLKKVFGGSKPSSKLILKTNGTTVMILQVMNN